MFDTSVLEAVATLALEEEIRDEVLATLATVPPEQRLAYLTSTFAGPPLFDPEC